jgi:hypothetical protein
MLASNRLGAARSGLALEMLCQAELRSATLSESDVCGCCWSSATACARLLRYARSGLRGEVGQ